MDTKKDKGQGMNVAMKARVVLEDGACGSITHWVIDLLTRRVTHLVVSVHGAQTAERLVTVGTVAQVAADTIQLRCTTADLDGMAPFTVIEWNPPEQSRFGPLLDGRLVDNLLIQPFFNVVRRECVPPEKMAVRTGLRVETVDGRVGRIEGLAVDPLDWRVRHLVLRSGPLWNSKAVTIPFGKIDRIGGKAVTAALDAGRPLFLPSGAAEKLGGRQMAL